MAAQLDYSSRELEKCLEFIKKVGTIEKPAKPIQKLATEVMLFSFRWPSDGPSSQGYKRARAVILALEKQGKIECSWSPGKRLTAIHLKKEVDPPFKQIIMATPIGSVDTGKVDDIIRRGNRNEDWAHTSLLKLIKVLTREFSETVLYGICKRSGKYDPSKGRIDLQDHYGQDFAFHLAMRNPNGPLISGYLIYDSKGSRLDVKKFNENIFYKEGQNGALLKKAIWANARLTSRKNFAKEVVSDCMAVGLLPNDFDKEKVLQFFED